MARTSVAIDGSLLVAVDFDGVQNLRAVRLARELIRYGQVLEDRGGLDSVNHEALLASGGIGTEFDGIRVAHTQKRATENEQPMTNSRNLSMPRGSKRREKVAPGATDLDRPLKLASAQALASAGLYVRTNVVLSEPRHEYARDGRWVDDITDVDVLGIMHSLDLSADVSCMTCKGGTNVSVIHETFALAG